jgi:hypothetical protein
MKIQILKIEPATNELISYYLNWKKPSIPVEYDTFGYLIYFKDIQEIPDDKLETLIKDFILLNGICKYANINQHTLSNISNKNEKINFIMSKIKKIKDKNIKTQMLNNFNNIKYFTVDEIRKELSEKSPSVSKKSKTPSVSKTLSVSKKSKSPSILSVSKKSKSFSGETNTIKRCLKETKKNKKTGLCEKINNLN